MGKDTTNDSGFFPKVEETIISRGDEGASNKGKTEESDVDAVHVFFSLELVKLADWL